MPEEKPITQFIVCQFCGNCFDSAFGLFTIIGCMETCPYCGGMNPTPDRLQSDPVPEMPPHVALRYLQAKVHPANYSDLVTRIKSVPLKDVAASYSANIARLHSLIDLPATLIYFSKVIEHHADKTNLVVFGVLDPVEITPEKDREWKDRMAASVAEWAHSTDAASHQREFVRIGQGSLPSMLRNGGAELQRGFEAILIGQITGVWTAFETLAGDLWEVALNMRPHGLAEMKGKPKHRISKLAGVGAGSGESAIQREDSKSNRDGVSLSLQEINKISKGDYDLSARMGTLLRNENNFTRLEGIRKAYSEAFFEHANKIDASLSDRSLDALNIVRNVFVHRAGRADKEYSSRAKSFPILPQLENGDRLPINGGLVGQLIGPVMKKSMELLEAVDSWLVSHTDIK
jgi:hypothetical protein